MKMRVRQRLKAWAVRATVRFVVTGGCGDLRVGDVFTIAGVTRKPRFKATDPGALATKGDWLEVDVS